MRERGVIRFYLPLPGASVLTYVQCRHDQFSRMDSLPNFLRYGAPRSRARFASAEVPPIFSWEDSQSVSGKNTNPRKESCKMSTTLIGQCFRLNSIKIKSG